MIYMSPSEIDGDPEPSAIPTCEEYRGTVACTGPRACYDENKRMARRWRRSATGGTARW